MLSLDNDENYENQEQHSCDSMQYHQNSKQPRAVFKFNAMFADAQEHTCLPLIDTQDWLGFAVHPDLPGWCEPFVQHQQ
jgi:hypothetical protein